ncbi:hypothetical protein AB0A63_31410 [Lentzea sp. NPDC042327]|uniref:hypothetical protein n=1 Tax=Lentzea sp. NPDC042327 TaxID=3154801 RepID=UPI0033FA82CA
MYEATADEKWVIAIRVVGTYEHSGKPYQRILPEDSEVEVWTERVKAWLASDAGLDLTNLRRPTLGETEPVFDAAQHRLITAADHRAAALPATRP